VADRAEIDREPTGKLAAPNIVEPPISVLHRPVVRHRLAYCLDRIRRVVRLPIDPGEGVFELSIGGARLERIEMKISDDDESAASLGTTNRRDGRDQPCKGQGKDKGGQANERCDSSCHRRRVPL
jgi:hypothetical protein